MENLEIYREDLNQLFSFALREYEDSRFTKNVSPAIQRSKKTFGKLTSVISLIVVEENRLYARRYDIYDGKILLFSFILGHSAVLYGQTSQRFREELLSSERVKGIATLKQSDFEHILIPVSIILLGNEDKTTWLTCAENLDQLINLFLGIFDGIKEIYYANELYPENLSPEYYNGDKEFIEETLSQSEVKELGDIAKVVLGKGASRYDYCDDGIPYLRVQDIKDGKIIRPQVCLSKDKASEYSRQLLQEGDIVLSKNFGQNKIALVTKDDIPAIVSNNLFIIRPFKVSEKYLYKYFKSKTGNEVFTKQLNRIKKGVTVPSITLSDLVHVKVPVFDESTMKAIEKVDLSSKDKAIKAIQMVTGGFFFFFEAGMQMTVMNNLISLGWKKENFKREQLIEISNERNWQADIVYLLEDGRKIIVEVVKSFTEVDGSRLSAIQQILQGPKEYFVILTTGKYYEIHKTGVSESFRTTNPPTIDEILNWEKEVL